MKTTRRQELKSNELAQFLEDAREFFRTYGNYVVGAVAVVALVLLGYVYMTRSAAQSLADATQQMRSLPLDTDQDVRDSVAKLRQLAAENQDEDFIMGALRWRAGRAMDRAHAADDGTPSREFLDMARAAFNEVLERHPDRTLDVGGALIGLATIEEDLFILDDDLAHKEAARRFLEQIRDNQDLNGTPFQTIALDRLNALDETFVQVVMIERPIFPAAVPGAPGGVADTLTKTPPGVGERVEREAPGSGITEPPADTDADRPAGDTALEPADQPAEPPPQPAAEPTSDGPPDTPGQPG
jgi:hypothetical protein